RGPAARRAARAAPERGRGPRLRRHGGGLRAVRRRRAGHQRARGRGRVPGRRRRGPVAAGHAAAAAGAVQQLRGAAPPAAAGAAAARRPPGRPAVPRPAGRAPVGPGGPAGRPLRRPHVHSVRVLRVQHIALLNEASPGATAAAQSLRMAVGSAVQVVGPPLGALAYAWSSTSGLPFPLDHHAVFLAAAGFSLALGLLA
ncbi:unnamed protein product, partial [Prorocentrum cordatum]